MRDYKKYDVWKRSHELTLLVYELTQTFPNSELYGLTSQLRRASSSVPTNIAEGSGRDSDKDFRRFLIIAHGSATEVEYLLLLCKDLLYIEDDVFDEFTNLITPLRKMLNSLIKKLSE